MTFSTCCHNKLFRITILWKYSTYWILCAFKVLRRETFDKSEGNLVLYSFKNKSLRCAQGQIFSKASHWLKVCLAVCLFHHLCPLGNPVILKFLRSCFVTGQSTQSITAMTEQIQKSYSNMRERRPISAFCNRCGPHPFPSIIYKSKWTLSALVEPFKQCELSAQQGNHRSTKENTSQGENMTMYNTCSELWGSDCDRWHADWGD